VAVGEAEIVLFWDPAGDNETAPEEIIYRIFLATEPGSQDFSNPTVAAPAGSTVVRVRDLDPGVTYYFVVRAEDAAGNQDDNRVEVSATTEGSGGSAFLRGDADSDGSLGLQDAVFLLEYLFLDGPAPLCLQVADADGSDAVLISDVFFLLNHLFRDGEAPPPLSGEEVAACEGNARDAVERGMAVFNEPDPGGNLYSCSTCHAAGRDDESELLLAGHSLQDALRRPSFKLGQLERFIDAANVCRVDWMKTTPWKEGDRSYQDLVSFLESKSPEDPAPALVYEIVPPAATGPSTGDPQAGCELFHRSCVVCHGPGGRGSALAPSLVSFPLGANYIRRKVRLSGPPGTVYEGLIGGNMPFWSRDRLSDDELEDLAAFLEARPVPGCAGDGIVR